jgi:endonuclease/exonuclease/phosphatase family metal-dependent hydrolase
LKPRGLSVGIIAVALSVAACVPPPRMAVVPAGVGVFPCRGVQSSELHAISWVVPTDSRHRARLDPACALLGPVVVQAGLAVQATPSTDRIAVLTWNTYLGRGNLDALVGGLRHGEFTGGEPVNAFVLLLQEVYRQDILERARTLGISAAFVPALRKPSDHDDRGNAVLSTFPIGTVMVVELPFEKQRRVAVAAQIQAVGADDVGRPFYAVSAHLTTSLGLREGGPGAARERQARALVDALRSIPPPIVIGGDLNTWWGDDEPAVKLLRSEYSDALPLNARMTWRGPLGAGTKLDYLFARTSGRPLTVRRLSSRFGSDHYPLLTIVG